MTTPASQPRIRRNEWRVLTPPVLGAWEPTLSLSVVIPAWNAGALLPTVLAGLAAQTYPAHLLEVLVVNDGPVPLTLPELRPERTRIVEVTEGWGRANACHTGALAADGDVLHWYDADMLAEPTQMEAQLRWHHLIDHAAVLGDKWFVDPTPVLGLDPAEVHAQVVAGRAADWFADQERVGHTWVDEIYEATDDLTQAGWMALRTHTGATASVRRELYLSSGGMDTSLRLGEDIALGAALARAGAVFIPDHEAVSWHLGPTHVMSRRERVNTYNDPFHAAFSPALRSKRRRGRSYPVPYLEVVVDARGHEALEVRALVDSVLVGSLTDVQVLLLGDWSTLDDGRAPVLDDRYDLRVVHATYAHEPRVRLLEDTPESLAEQDTGAAFRLWLPGVRFAPRRLTLEKQLLHLEHTHDGLRRLHLKDGSVARLVRTAALSRARRVALPGEDLDAVIAEIAGAQDLTGREAGFGPAEQVRPRGYPRATGPAVSSEEAWARIEGALGEKSGEKSGERSGPPTGAVGAAAPAPGPLA